MTDDSPLPREPSDDVRDERLAARLQTEPLDDVTRARLVRKAMTASEPEVGRERRTTTRVRWTVAVAAALIVILVAGVAVLARDDSGSGPTAARAPKADSVLPDTVETTPAVQLSPGDQALSFSIVSGVPTLGDLGDVSRAALLRRAVRAAEAAAPASADTSANRAGSAAEALPQSNTSACAPSLPGNVVAVGTGTAHGKPVTVYVVERTDGSRAALVVRADCDVGEPVPL